MPRNPEQEVLHSRAKRRGAQLAKRALPPLRISSLDTSDLSKATYRLLIRALRAEVKRLQGSGGLDLETLGSAGKVLELLASGAATLEIKPATSPGQVVNILNSSSPTDMARLIAHARGVQGGELGAGGTQVPPGGHSVRELSVTGTPSDIDVSPQPAEK